MKSSHGKKPFVLLDRDGTLIEERHYLSDPKEVALIPGAAEGLRALAEADFGLVLLTNQSGLARGFFDWNTLKAIHRALERMLAKEGIILDGIYICPHLPEAGCECRKPKPGLALTAGRELGFDPAETVVVGDKACDVELGKNISARTILVGTGHGAEQSEETRTLADRSVLTLGEACKVILDWERHGISSTREDIRYG